VPDRAVELAAVELAAVELAAVELAAEATGAALLHLGPCAMNTRPRSAVACPPHSPHRTRRAVRRASSTGPGGAE
jgi:hypothetical protein